MKTVFAISLCAISAVLALEPPLPTWKPDEKKAYEQSGGVMRSLLLMDESAEEAAAKEHPPLEVEKPKAEEVVRDPARSSEIPEKFLSAYFANKPAEFLVDPQGLLTAKDFKDRLSFLKYHASDSAIDFYIYVFGGEQEIPGEVRAEETVERLFNTGRPAAVVFYFLGAPQRSEIHLSPSLTEGIPAPEQRRALQSSVMVAFDKLNLAEQLEAFSVQMSIRIYWMERMLVGEESPENQPAFSRRPGMLKKAKPSMIDDYKIIAIDLFEKWWGPASLAVGCAMLLSALIAWLRMRVRLRFPDLDVEPRLGGAHAAGVGAVISFASASLPPASQKDQVPDYLRRA